MSRNKTTNGVAETLERLFGRADDRKLLSKYVGTGVFDQHLEEGDPKVFKRSTECDNLIKNILALDNVFRSQDLTIEAVKGTLSAKKAIERILSEKVKMGEKFKAYGYWLNRTPSLIQLFENGFNMEAATIEDLLEPSPHEHNLGSSSPYALRAVRLLEKVEEEGRLSKLSPEQQIEKAWALYRLGLRVQAVSLATEATKADPTLSEGWVLLADNSLVNQATINKDYQSYVVQKDIADPLSSHEQWAEEMQSHAAGEYFGEKRKEKHILFNALYFWPREEDNPDLYAHLTLRGMVRASCIDWLFTLLEPYNNYRENQFDTVKTYKAIGLYPEYTRKFRPSLNEEDVSDLPSHSLNDIEFKVAHIICEETDNPSDKIRFRSTAHDPFLRELKLLHIRYALNTGNYKKAKAKFRRTLKSVHSREILQIIKNENLRNAFITNVSDENLSEVLANLNAKLELDRRKEQGFIELNLARKSYDHNIWRGQFSECICIASDAYDLLENLKIDAPDDSFYQIYASNKLSSQFWRYLQILAACQSEEAGMYDDLTVSTLLLVPEPDTYFSNESDYMSHQCDEYMDWYQPVYGDSIIESGQWLNSLARVIDNGGLSDSDYSIAENIRSKLKSLLPDED